jgi:hypothetical protein
VLFLKRAIKNNTLMILFWVLYLAKIIVLTFSINVLIIPAVILVSVLLSFVAIHKGTNARRKKVTKEKAGIKFSPAIKSALNDYGAAVPMAVTAAVLSLYITVEFFRDAAMAVEMKDPLFIPLALLVVLSFGLIGIWEVTSKTNWLFYALISPDFKYHVKRIMLFVLCFYGIIVIQYIAVLIYIDVSLLFIYTFGIIVVLLFSVCLVFIGGNILKKIFIYATITGILIYTLYSNPYLVLLAIAPLFFLWKTAKNEFVNLVCL